MELLDVALPDAQGEDLDAAFPQSRRHWPRVAAVGVAVGDQEDDLGGVGSGGAQDLLLEKRKKTSRHHLFCLTWCTTLIQKTRNMLTNRPELCLFSHAGQTYSNVSILSLRLPTGAAALVTRRNRMTRDITADH